MVFEINRWLVEWGYERLSAGSPIFSILSNYSELDVEWLLRRLGFVDKRVVCRQRDYIEIYWIRGFSKDFFIALDGFLNYIYGRAGYFVCDIDTFKGSVRGIIECSLLEGLYDIGRAKFFSYIYYLAVKWVRGERKRSIMESPIHLNDVQMDRKVFCQHRDNFFTRCIDLGVVIDRDVFASNLIDGKVTPLVFSFLWLFCLGELDNAEG